MNWTINQSEVACSIQNKCLGGGWSEGEYSFALIPAEYQGWALLTLLILGTIAILVGLYVITTDIPEKKIEETKDHEPRSKGKRK
jgi:hypothetical protein